MAFPGAKVHQVSHRREFIIIVRTSWFADARSFEALGSPNGDEVSYAGDVRTLDESKRRFVQIKAIVAPGGSRPKPAYVALLNYEFTGITHCFQCYTTWVIARMERDGASWKSQLFSDPDGATDSIISASFADLAGDGPHYALIETETVAHPPGKGRILNIFDMNDPKFVPVSRYSIAEDNDLEQVMHYEKKLNIQKTRESHGQSLVFGVVTSTRDNKFLQSPETSEETVPFRMQQAK
jgi:hypothetical protein